jgi:sarcosine oxidase
MRNIYDAIVIGVGGVGSAALWQLASRGARVMGIDRFSPGHDRGSSHGETRIIRLAYFEHPDYVPLLRRAYQLWADVERQTNQKLFHQVGLLQAGPLDGEVVSGVLTSARQHSLVVDTMTPAEAMRRFPAFSVEPGDTAVFEPTAGYLRVEACVRACFQLAQQAGAEFREATAMAWRHEHGEFIVETADGSFCAKKLVVSPGAWASSLLPEFGQHLVVRRKPLYWFESPQTVHAASAGCPTFLFERGSHAFYGFPAIDGLGVKAAEHTGGAVLADPLRDRRPEVIDAVDLSQVWAFVKESLPGVLPHVTRHSVCLYTMSPDGHFVVDRLPANEHVAICAGLSGHGFKFVTVLGQILADLTLAGKTELPIAFLNSTRFTRPR